MLEPNWKQGVAQTLLETIKIIDNVPLNNDISPEFFTGSFAPRASLLHTALELGMKSLNKDFDQNLKEHRTHDLIKVYNQITNPETKTWLQEAFANAVAFYGFNPNQKQYAHLKNIKAYLEKTGKPDAFSQYRYWALEQKLEWLSRELIETTLILNREMARFIAHNLKNYGKSLGGPFYLSTMIEIEIETRVLQNCAGTQEQADQWPVLLNWAKQHPSWLEAMKDAYQQEFNLLNEYAGPVLRKAYSEMGKTDHKEIQPAMTYALSLIGMKTAECADAQFAVIDESPNADSAFIKTPGDNPLGTIRKRHDGRWEVRPWPTNIKAEGKPEITARRKDAISLMVEKTTEVITLSLNGNPPTKRRVYLPKGYIGSEVENLEFWSKPEDIKKNDRIAFALPALKEAEHYYEAKVLAVEEYNIQIEVEKNITQPIGKAFPA